MINRLNAKEQGKIDAQICLNHMTNGVNATGAMTFEEFMQCAEDDSRQESRHFGTRQLYIDGWRELWDELPTL